MISTTLLGQFLALFSAFCFAGTGVCVSRTKMHEGDRGVMFSVVVTILFSVLLWLWMEGPNLETLTAPHSAAGIFWYVVSGLCAMVVGRSFLYVSIRRLGPTRSAATKRLNPFFSVVVAAVVLAEPITKLTGIGMVAIAVAFAIMIHASFRAASGKARPGASHVPTVLDYSWGVASALAYAAAYVARKLGLHAMPSPALGTLISALAGFGTYLVMAAINPKNLRNLMGMFRNLDGWLICAAVLMSAGQIALFFALMYERIAVVVMISSLEIFIASFLSVVVFKTETRPDPLTYLAAVIATGGVVVVSLG